MHLLCENPEKPHEWEDPGNAHGKVSVQMHGYPGGRVKTLITAIEAGLFVHYTPHVVICQIEGNAGCSNTFFDEKPSCMGVLSNLVVQTSRRYWYIWITVFSLWFGRIITMIVMYY
jgi:hypothetical protein